MKFTKLNPGSDKDNNVRTAYQGEHNTGDTGNNTPDRTFLRGGYCTSCGSRMEPGSRFCINCGADMKNEGPDSVGSVSTGTEQRSRSAYQGSMVNRGSEVNPIIGFFKKENKLVLALIGVVLAGWIGLFALVASSISSDTGTSVSEDKTGTETTLAAESSLTVDNDEDMTENPSLDPIVSAPVTEESTMEEDSLIIDSIVSAESVTTDVAEDSSSGEESGIADTEAETGDDNGYTFTEMAVVMYASSGLNVRDLPDKNGNSLGKLEQNEKISVTGQCNETNWYRIDYSGQTAYVSNEFVSSAPKEEDQPKTTQKTGDGDAVVATGGNDNSGSGSSGGGGSNFVTYDNPEQQQTSASYVLNTSTMKFHLPNCNSVKKIAPQNYATANNRADIMAQGYQPCKNCNP